MVVGVACYIRNDIVYNRLRELEDDMLEVLWIKVMPRKPPRKCSCILVGCLDYTHQTDFLQMREHVITGIDTVTYRRTGRGEGRGQLPPPQFGQFVDIHSGRESTLFGQNTIHV